MADMGVTQVTVTAEMEQVFKKAWSDYAVAASVGDRNRAGLIAVLAVVRRDAPARILDFRWSNYGLDEVEDASPEYADALAGKIMTGQDS